jgi:hypothetical protein
MSKSMIFQGEKTNKILLLFLLSTETSRGFLCLFFPLFPSILRYQTFGEVLKKISKISQIYTFFYKKTFFFQKNKKQFSFLSVPRPTKEKEKKSLNSANLSHS